MRAASIGNVNGRKLWNWDKIGPILGESDEEWPGRPRKRLLLYAQLPQDVEAKGHGGKGRAWIERPIGLFAAPLVGDLVTGGTPRHPGKDLDEHLFFPGREQDIRVFGSAALPNVPPSSARHTSEER